MPNETFRGTGMKKEPDRASVGLPTRPFLFTLDQISVMLEVRQETIERSYIYFQGRSIGRRTIDLMLANNVAPPNEKAEWRVAEREFIRWMKVKGWRYYDRGSMS